jgi:mannosyltransferase OCH1-like enzyme
MNCEIDQSKQWSLTESLFNTNYVNLAEHSINLIPKIIHQVWLGSKFPDKLCRLRDTWIDMHPGWEYRLWTDDDVDSFGLNNINSFNAIKNFGSKSDIFRYEILHRHGGIYVDVDFECIKPFDDLTYLEFFTGTGYTDKPYWYNGLFACKPEHPILSNLIQKLKSLPSHYDIWHRTGPGVFTTAIDEYLAENQKAPLVIFPTVFFFPMPNTERWNVRQDTLESREIVKKYLHSETRCVHLWYCSWQ